MKKHALISSSSELAHFLFEQMGVRWQVSERPILTMHTVRPYASLREQTVPVWLWTITIFISNEAGQSVEGRSMTEQLELDRKPDEAVLIDLFVQYSFISRNIWDRHHSRCYGYPRWKRNNHDSSLCTDEDLELYRGEKVAVLALRALLGVHGFRQFISANL